MYIDILSDLNGNFWKSKISAKLNWRFGKNKTVTSMQYIRYIQNAILNLSATNVNVYNGEYVNLSIIGFKN